MYNFSVHRIKINGNNIQILSAFDKNEILFTIWLEDFNNFREAFDKCEQYEKELQEIRKKYED